MKDIDNLLSTDGGVDALWLYFSIFNFKNMSTESYIYLMKDKSMGFYKIGLAYEPIQRERTLQAERPTITLLASRKFDSRDLAQQAQPYIDYFINQNKGGVGGHMHNIASQSYFKYKKEVLEK